MIRSIIFVAVTLIAVEAPAQEAVNPRRCLANQVLHLQEDEAGRPGDRRPLPARLEGNGQAARHRLLLRRRLDQRHDQGSSSRRPPTLPAGHGRRTGRLPGEVPARRHARGMRRGRQECRPLAAAERRHARRRSRPHRGLRRLGGRPHRRLHRLQPGLEAEGEDTKISSKPNALVLFNPVLRFDGIRS